MENAAEWVIIFCSAGSPAAWMAALEAVQPVPAGGGVLRVSHAGDPAVPKPGQAVADRQPDPALVVDRHRRKLNSSDSG
jgi:hypothetical protein